MGQFLEEHVDKGNELGEVEKQRRKRRHSNRRRGRRRSSRRRSSYGLPLGERDEEELMQVYNETVAVTEEDILENLQTQKEIIENVKTQPWKMAKKIKMLRLARSYVEKFEGKLSRSKGYQQKWKTFFRQLSRSWTNLIASLVPWETRIKTIESHFGSVVASYFVFLRWIIWINIWLTILPVAFVIIPEMVAGNAHGSVTRKTIPENEQDTSGDLKTIWDAEGIVKYSVFFYGYYGSQPTIGSGYRQPLAYLLSSLASFALSFIFVLKTMANNSRQSRMSTKDEHFTFAWKIFTEWDYMIGNKETAKLKHASLVTTFREAILEEEEKTKEGNKHLLLFLRILANVLVVLSLALSTYIIQLFVDRSRNLEIAKRQNKALVGNFWEENELTVIMTLISTLFPNISDLISLMEKYHPRINLRLQLARIFALNLLNLYTLFIALYYKQDDLKKDIQKAFVGNGTVLCNTTVTTTPTTVSESPVNCTMPGTTASDLCWETMIGQEVFKLTIMDLIFFLGQIIIIDFIRGVFMRYCNSICCWDMEKKFPEYPEFKTAENLLHLINNQGVIWLGTFFSPGLPVLNMIKLLIMVYVRCWTVMVCNVPQERIFRASRSNNFYYALLLVMLFLCMLPPLFAIVGVEPSPGCGPFSGSEKMFYVITDVMENALPASANAVMGYVASPGVIIPVFLLLLMTIYYLVSVGRSLRDANNQLRMQLEYERTEGRRKVYAMADAKREAEGDVTGRKGPDLGAKPKKKGMGKAVTSVLIAHKIAKMMSGTAQEASNPKRAASNQIPVAVVQGKRSVKEKWSKEKLVRDAMRSQERKLAMFNRGYDPTGDEDITENPMSQMMTNGKLRSVVSKVANKRQNRTKKPASEPVQQNIELKASESSDDEEIATLAKTSSSKKWALTKGKLGLSRSNQNLLEEPKTRRSRSSSNERQNKKSSSNTSVEYVNETVEAEVNVRPPKRTSPKAVLVHSESKDSVDTSSSVDNLMPTNTRNNLSSKRNLNKSIPTITVEDCSDDNASGTEAKVMIDVDSSDSETTESSDENHEGQCNNSLNVSLDADIRVDDRSSAKERFRDILQKFKSSESEGGSSDEQNSPNAVSLKTRFNKALNKFNKR